MNHLRQSIAIRLIANPHKIKQVLAKSTLEVSQEVQGLMAEQFRDCHLLKEPELNGLLDRVKLGEGPLYLSTYHHTRFGPGSLT